MDVFVITKTHFTGADQYSSVVGVCATQKLALSWIDHVPDKNSCINYHISKHSLIGF